MKLFLGAIGLLTAAAIVGVLAVQELHRMTNTAGGPVAVISATVTGATPQPESPAIAPDQNPVEATVNQAGFAPLAPDD